MKCWKQIFVIFLSIYPLFGECCSCKSVSGRNKALKQGVCYGDAYTGVVLGATCACSGGTATEGTETFDCREYSYSESEGTYTAEVLRRVEVSGTSDDYYRQYIKTCKDAEDTLAQGVTFQFTGVEPDVTTENDTGLHLICDGDDNDYLLGGFVCVYRVRVTEVFVGNFSAGDVITSAGPDTGTSCSLDEGRILKLRAEYLAGVGGACTTLIDWGLLSAYSDKELDELREFADNTDPEKCSSPRLLPIAAVVVFLTAGLISLLV